MTMTSLQFPRLRFAIAVSPHRLLAWVLLAPLCIALPAFGATVDETRCGVLYLPGQYGPFDYRVATQEQKSLVEGAHFTPDVEQLIKGSTSTTAGGDLDYTLRAFPNHPRALKSMMDLGVREKTPRPRGSRWTVDCYFNRALRLTPDDPMVRMVLGIYLLRNGEKKGAVEQLEIARTIGASSANFHYNLGLAYFQVQDYEKARTQAYKARELGYELQGLKNMLVRAGQWREKPPESTPPPAPDAPAGSDAAKADAPKPDAATGETVLPKN
jgi:tetratricopeptide (TPR) repeat protein